MDVAEHILKIQHLPMTEVNGNPIYVSLSAI